MVYIYRGTGSVLDNVEIYEIFPEHMPATSHGRTDGWRRRWFGLFLEFGPKPDEKCFVLATLELIYELCRRAAEFVAVQTAERERDVEVGECCPVGVGAVEVGVGVGDGWVGQYLATGNKSREIKSIAEKTKQIM